jgi:chromate reductase
MKKILAIVGSLRKDSFNKQLALAAKKALEGKAELEILDYTGSTVFQSRLRASGSGSCD